MRTSIALTIPGERFLRTFGVLSALALALALALLLTQMLLASEEVEPVLVLRTLQPGDNLVGWVDYPITPQELFEQIPEAELIYAWDAQHSRYRVAARELQAGLEVINPGMGLVVRISADHPVEWEQPSAANGERLTLHPGPNLVAWTGPSDSPIDLAVRSIGDTFEHALYWMSDQQQHGVFEPGRGTSNESMHTLRRGDALWVFGTEETSWLQPSGDRPLHPLGPPPDHIRWYASFDKYLDADGIAFISTENVADEALFRAAAIFDEMLVNRPDIRQTLVRRRVHIVVVGQTEETFDLTPYKQYRDRIELEPHGPGGPRGLGPNQFTPTLVPEENLLCLDGDRFQGHDVAVHEYAHAIDFAISSGLQSGNFRSALTAAYRTGREAGFWEGTHAMRNTAEYWATGVQAWLGVVGRFYSTVINRHALTHYAPSLATLVADTLGDIQLHTSCQPADAKSQGSTERILVSGSLLDSEGEVLPGVDVVLRPQSDSGTFVQTSLSPKGKFTTFVKPGTYTLRYSIEGCQVYHGKDGLILELPSADPISLIDEDWSVAHQLRAGMCQLISTGKITNSKGMPLAKLNLSLSSRNRLSRGMILPNGEFKIRVPEPGQFYVQIHYKTCYYAYDGQDVISMSLGAPLVEAARLTGSPLDFKLPANACAGEISGKVLDQSGQPAQGAIVSLYQPDFLVGYPVQSDGRFSRQVDWPADHILVIHSNGCRLFFGANEFSEDLSDVEPLKMRESRIRDLEIRIPPDVCDS